ncbi:MAG: metalloregulator ArsR/SmtB family transcription factor [Acidobacteriota bacterium]|nr:metalloregulator ArsR/SmtB family transcription factor [Acidobacteriota bacterium]
MVAKNRAQQELDDLEVVFKAPAHPSRRHILIVLNAHGGRMSAGSIAERFACSWPTTTRHLRRLEDAGLIIRNKTGREQNYTLNRERLQAVVGQWLAWFAVK